MAIDSLNSLLFAFIDATTNAGVKAILNDIGDLADSNLDTPFGCFGLQWHAFGNNASNISTIGLATKPGRSIAERLTNAADALLEERVQLNVTPPVSPRHAAKTWFSRPISGPDDGLFKWDYAEHDIDKRASVVLLPSGSEAAPTIDVVDDGIGIMPDDFASTILSLQSGNKITKWYLIGAFGQGGASTLAFCDYALIVSRPKEKPSICGFTVIRVLNLNETYKEDCYAYLALPKAGYLTVPSCEIGVLPLRLYPHINEQPVPQLAKGTLVRHHTYKLPRLSGKLGPGTGNLYHYLHATLFDPLFPFRVYDLREHGVVRDELIKGSRNRLMRLQQEGETDSRTEIKHYRPMEYVTPLGAEDASVGIEYWVVLNQKKLKTDEYVLRAHSHELFVETGHPIIGTLNGQNQGQLSARLLKEMGLGMVARHIVVHLDATNVNSKVRRELFSTNREGFKDGPVLDDLTRVLRQMLEEDENLFAIERELTERIAKREAETTSEEVRRQLISLLVEAGLQVREQGPAFREGGESKVPHTRRKLHRYEISEPLPTLPFPQVTRFKIVSPQETLTCHINDNELVLVETDADAEFDRQGRIAIRCDPPVLEQAGKAPLRGGRVRWRLRPRTEAKAGDIGIITASITKIDGSQLTAEVLFEVLPAIEEGGKKEKGFVPPFKIIPVDPYDHLQDWLSAWPDLEPDAVPEEKLRSVAYKPIDLSGVIHIFYSTIFPAYRDHVDKLKSQSPAMVELFNTNYTIWIGYHAILQERGRNKEADEIDSDVLERLLEDDRVRVAQMQAKQAAKTAELQHKALRAASAGEN
jgi:hypothetical protein